MDVPAGNRDLKFFQKTKIRFMDVCEYEIETLKIVKTQFRLLSSFSMNRNEEVQHMQHYFNQMQPIILNENNIDMLNHLLNYFVDEVKGEIEANRDNQCLRWALRAALFPTAKGKKSNKY